MFCENCGNELADDVIFCPNCGTKRIKILNEKDQQQDVNVNPQENAVNEDINPDPLKSKTNTSSRGIESQFKKKEAERSIVSQVWNSQLFTTMAIKFGNILEVLEGIVGLILSILLFKEGGFWGIAFGILFLLGGAGSCINGIMPLLLQKKMDNEEEPLSETDLNKKKRNLCIGTIVIIIALILLGKSGGGTYSIVKSISFDNMGSETIGEIVDENIKSPEWSQKKLDNSSKLVYVEGYCPSYGEKIRIEFYYEKTDDGSHEVALSKIYCPESNQELNTFEAAMVWASFYY